MPLGIFSPFGFRGNSGGEEAMSANDVGRNQRTFGRSRSAAGPEKR